MRIDNLTQEQLGRFAEWSRKWIEIGLSTERADFDRATEAALKAYKLCNLKQPMVVLRVGSPYAATVGGALAWMMLREYEKAFKEKTGKQVRQQVWQQVEQQVWQQVEQQVRQQVRQQVEQQVGQQVEQQVWQQVEQQVRQQVFGAARDGFNNYRGGSFWASWCAYITFFRDVMGWKDATLESFSIDEVLAETCGWVWWHENVLAISDRPSALHRDDQGRLHCATGPSLEYRDGWKLYHWHGISISADIIEHPETITVAAIDAEANAEVRRVMMERYGADRYLLDSGAKPIQRDDCGILYRKEIPGDEPLVMVRVINSTPEPDGVLTEAEARETFGDDVVNANIAAMWRSGFKARELLEAPRFKQYFLRVPPTIKTAREAVAWTFDMKPEDYRPEFQS